jgi:hypothetical protein
MRDDRIRLLSGQGRSMRRNRRQAAGHCGMVLFAIHAAVDLHYVMIRVFLDVNLGSGSRTGQPKQGSTHRNTKTYKRFHALPFPFRLDEGMQLEFPLEWNNPSGTVPFFAFNYKSPN